MSEAYLLFGSKGSGSLAVEAALTLIGAEFQTQDVPHGDLPATTLLAQVPAIRLPSGEVMTESLAILLWLAETYPEAKLAPAVGDPARPAFLRWMAYVSSAIYAHYWAMDFPDRVTSDEAAQAEVKAALEARVDDCWAIMEAAVEPRDYLLGDTLTVLDLYVTVVSRWTSRKALHETIAPRLGAAVRRVEHDPRLAALWASRFPLPMAM